MEGWFQYKGIVTQQHKDIKEPFGKLFTSTSPKRILEIGTASGGLTLLLRDLLDYLGMHDVPIRTYDIVDKHHLGSYINDGVNIEVIIKELFNETYEDLIEIDEFKSYIQQPGTTIVLCDGGNKKNEFKLLSQFLKSDDIIMAHDYACDEGFFNQYVKDIIWNWMEIQDSDIEESSIKHGLSKHMFEDFYKVAWVCRKKL